MRQNFEIMVVEDDASLGFLLKDGLDLEGWNVHLYADGEEGLSAFRGRDFDLCILDVMLPIKDGYEVAREIRSQNHQVPIIFLTARSQTEDRIRGFQMGADDYVCKPFSIEEFKYRVEAVLKRSAHREKPLSTDVVDAANSSLDIRNLILDSNGVITQLTYKEAKLLEIFFRHTNDLIARELFLKTVWEDDGFFVARSMDVFVSRLRKYLKADTRLRIENVRGIGYVLKERK